jgi:hypothetical protein
MVLKRPIEKDRIEMAEEDLQRAREEFIKGGGLVSCDISDIKHKEEWKKIILRVKTEAIMQIDALVENKMGMTRTAWILQAIEDKLKQKDVDT